jgi:serine/threonine-protein kinase
VASEDDAPTLQGSLGHGPTGQLAAVESPMVPDEERYDIGKQLGRGGMGEVRVAHDTRVDREVAVKLLRPEQTRDHDTVTRFLREARIQGRLDHPAVVPVHDLGIDRYGHPFFVMKRLTGITLAEVLEGMRTDHVLRDKWPRRALLARFVDVCLAVEFAHTRGVVHRDLKPSNIMLGDFGEVYVLDWGLARVRNDGRISQPIAALPGDSGGPAQTAVGSVLGTPGYMPPEQIRNPAVDGRADVYALGCILYEILTGQPALPTGMDALDATLAAVCHRPSEKFTELVSPELDDICARATAADTQLRPTARELGDAVQAYLDGDRDMARRRELARRHAKRAQESFASTGDAARARAMREAGRALVLDANNVDAQGVLAHLLLDAPHVIPEIAREEANRERSRQRQEVLKWVWRGYLGIFLIMMTLYAFPIRHVEPILACQLLTLATGAATYAASRRPLPIRHGLLALAIWLNATTIAAGAITFGPLLIVPVFLVGTVAGSLSQPTGHRWPLVVLPPVLGFAVPLVLELVDLLPSSFHVEHGLVLTPYAIELTSSLTLVLVVIGIASQIAITVAMMSQARSIQDDAQDRLHAQTWHLQQLLPRRTTSQKAPDSEIRLR